MMSEDSMQYTTDQRADGEYVTAKRAAELLQVSRVKMAKLLDKGILPFEHNPFDARQKLIPIAEVRRLIEEGMRKGVSGPKARKVA